MHIFLLKNAHASQLTQKSLGICWTGISVGHMKNPTVFFSTISWWKLLHPKPCVKVTHQQTISHLLWNWKKAAGAQLCPATLPGAASTSHWNSCSYRKHSNPVPPVYFTIPSQIAAIPRTRIFYPKRVTLIRSKVFGSFDDILISAFENFRDFLNLIKRLTLLKYITKQSKLA